MLRRLILWSVSVALAGLTIAVPVAHATDTIGVALMTAAPEEEQPVMLRAVGTSAIAQEVLIAPRPCDAASVWVYRNSMYPLPAWTGDVGPGPFDVTGSVVPDDSGRQVACAYLVAWSEPEDTRVRAFAEVSYEVAPPSQTLDIILGPAVVAGQGTQRIDVRGNTPVSRTLFVAVPDTQRACSTLVPDDPDVTPPGLVRVSPGPFDVTIELALGPGTHRVCAVLLDRSCWRTGCAPWEVELSREAAYQVLTPVQVPAAAQAPVAARGLTVKVTPKRDRRAPYRFTVSGRLLLPAGVTAATGCTGSVTVEARRRGKRVARRAAKIVPTCRWSTTVRIARRGKASIAATFRGNAAVKPMTSRAVSIRAG